MEVRKEVEWQTRLEHVGVDDARAEQKDFDGAVSGG